ncbi:Amidohydrolase 3 [Nitrosomonas sp. Is79A3]|uniref:amidohydrolase family protein n=1 Tax=Nitrosomonas sp. (strain Is79A3) TaxID=261292 RepID=UPI000215CECC
MTNIEPSLIFYNGKVTTLDKSNPEVTAIALASGFVSAAGSDKEICALAGPDAKMIDLKGKRVIPGLNDSHLHLIRGGLNYNMELRWDGINSLADALAMLKIQADRTPAPQWVRVVGGWSEFQFNERRMPTLEEINSTRHFMRELNRLGVTSCIDAGGGFQNYPEDYAVIENLHEAGLMTIRIAYNLFTQNKGGELADFRKWANRIKPYSGDGYLRHNGAGEMLVFSAADFEDFLQPRPDMAASMEKELGDVVRFLVENRWPFRLHATYDETIDRALDVFETINRDTKFGDVRWFFDHAETVSEKNLERIKRLNGGIAVQHRMAFQGEYFVDRYGQRAAEHSPRLRKMLNMGIPVGGGTDATRVASYSPWVSLYWMVTGRTVGGLPLYGDSNRLEREEALYLWTQGSAYKSNEEMVKGILMPGMYADFAVLSQDLMTVPDEAIKVITSIMTVVGGKIVYADAEFKSHDTPLPPVSPDWSPVRYFGGYQDSSRHAPIATNACMTPGCGHHHAYGDDGKLSRWLNLNEQKGKPSFKNPWAIGCGCFAY